MNSEKFAAAFRSAVSSLLLLVSEKTKEQIGLDTELFKKQGGPSVKFRDLVEAFIETEQEGLVTIDDKELTFSKSVSHRCYDCPVSAGKDIPGPGFWFQNFLAIANQLGCEKAVASRGAKKTTANKVAQALTAADLLAMRVMAIGKANAIGEKTEETNAAE